MIHSARQICSFPKNVSRAKSTSTRLSSVLPSPAISAARSSRSSGAFDPGSSVTPMQTVLNRTIPKSPTVQFRTNAWTLISWTSAHHASS